MRGASLLLALALLGVLGCADDPDPLETRAARIEERLLATCSCHPKRIVGLPLEREIRAAIRRGIEAGQEDDAILWAVLQTHGTALLEAGIEDVAQRAAMAAVETVLILLLAGGALLLQLRRRPHG